MFPPNFKEVKGVRPVSGIKELSSETRSIVRPPTLTAASWITSLYASA